jgi:glyoxylase-like metal-dependent hydrolase (beta-lactamase superfamily II)
MRTFRVGDAKVSSINVGDFNFRLKDTDDVPESEWKGKYSDVFENAHLYPSQSFLISFPNLSLLVDAGDYSKFASTDKDMVAPNYKPPPTLLEQLKEAGVSRGHINYVVITHAHYDHYAGVTIKGSDGRYLPAFPGARHMMGKQDFDSQDMQSALRDPNSEDNQTIGVLLRSGLLELVPEGRELSDEIEIIAAPGETPGHKIVKIASGRETLYCVGDLFHHAVEVEHPKWMAKWDNPETNLRSRSRLIETALREGAFIAAAHMPLGRLERQGAGVKFVEI